MNDFEFWILDFGFVKPKIQDLKFHQLRATTSGSHALHHHARDLPLLPRYKPQLG